MDGPAPRTDLSVRRVRTAALAILDAEGPDALSMRRLAKALDRKAMTLYRYARSKADLLDGVVELVLEDLHIDASAEDWREQLRMLAQQFQSLAIAHPHVVTLMVTLPKASPLGFRPLGTLRLLEDFIELLTRAGSTRREAVDSYRLFFGFLHGHVLEELQEFVDDGEKSADRLQVVLHQLPRAQFPQLRALGAGLAAYDGAAQLRRGVEMMIAGIQDLLTVPTPTPA